MDLMDFTNLIDEAEIFIWLLKSFVSTEVDFKSCFKFKFHSYLNGSVKARNCYLIENFLVLSF